MSNNNIYSVDEEEQKRQADHKLRPRPIDINQKLEILVHTLEEVEEEKNAIFFSDLTTVQYSDEPEPVKVSQNKLLLFFFFFFLEDTSDLPFFSFFLLLLLYIVADHAA